MDKHTIYYATNRKHEGKDRWKPNGYGSKFSDDGMENLRFGKVTLEANEKKVQKFLEKEVGDIGIGNGEDLSNYLAEQAESAKIAAFKESLASDKSDIIQPKAKLGSLAAFGELRKAMLKGCDVLIYIHGYNVSWAEAVGSANALQIMLNRAQPQKTVHPLQVVLFTWPSDGQALPYVSYQSDRSEAAGSGKALGRGILKVRDFLAKVRAGNKKIGEKICNRKLHLLCHSMGNFALQHTLERINQFTPGRALPRIFENIFLCAADVDDDSLETGHPLGQVHELTRSVNVYHNKGDLALVISDYTKGHPDRLGSAGTARPRLVHNKVQQIDCTPIVEGLVEHSYYLVGNVNRDIRQSIDGMAHQDTERLRARVGETGNQWEMVKA
ncbi:MAG: alpha/beta hydrolase [Nitrospirota bacterium]|nr:MAG: alpha/beta hydrolase [Nitrospirota bacterium]